MLMLIVKPILKILFIPINILTFGLLSWVINVIVIYLLTSLCSGNLMSISGYFPAATWAGFIIPPIHFTYLTAMIASSLLITIITDVLHYVSED